MRKTHIGLMAATACIGALGRMTPAEMAKGRYLRAPDHDSSTGGGEKTPEQLAKEVKADFDKRFDETKGIAERALAEAEKGVKLTPDEKQKIDEALTLLNETKARLDEVEQKAARRSGGEPQEHKSLGLMVTEGNEEAIAKLASHKGRFGIDIDSGVLQEQKAIVSSLTTVAAGSAGDLIVPTRGALISPPQRQFTVRDLIAPGRSNSNAIQYPQETGFTNAAATVSETTGPAKPQSDIQFDIRTASVTTIAHWVLATRQILDDVPALQSYINGRLLYGLAYAEELQLLNGDGLGTNLNGIYTQATAFASPIPVTAGATRVDVLRVAQLQAVLAEYPPNGFVLHPVDWTLIELQKTTDGAYLFSNPTAGQQPRIWGLPVVQTQAMTVNKFLTGSFNLGAQIFDRQDARVEISTEDSDNFRKNLVTILAEERLALAVYRPESFVKGDFTTAITDITS